MKRSSSLSETTEYIIIGKVTDYLLLGVVCFCFEKYAKSLLTYISRVDIFYISTVDISENDRGDGVEKQSPLTEGIYYILLSLYEPRHGYGIMQDVLEMSKGRVELGPGTIYGAIKSLVKKKWIKPVEEDGRRKEYIITKEGKIVVEQEIERLRELYENGLIITKGAKNV